LSIDTRSQSFIFSSGTARGGTNLLNLCLSVHPEIQISQDPLIPFFKFFRREIFFTEFSEPRSKASVSLPLDEYYFFDAKLERLDAIQNSDFGVQFSAADFPFLREELEKRMSFSSPKLIPLLPNLVGDTYDQVFESAIRLMQDAWDSPGIAFPGFNDNWAIEFFRPVARSFPNAKFVVLIRDVRAAIASHVRLLDHNSVNPLYQYEKTKELIALTLSFTRCWRKQIAFLSHYLKSEFAERLYWLRYEDLVADPAEEIQRIMTFLDLDYSDEMVDTEKFISPDGNKWLPNTNHQKVASSGIYSSTVDRWKETLSGEAIELIELVAGPELELCGYSLASEIIREDRFPAGAYRYHYQDSAECKGWRTDNLNVEVDLGLELMRRKYLLSDQIHRGLDRRFFLTFEVAKLLREGGSALVGSRGRRDS